MGGFFNYYRYGYNAFEDTNSDGFPDVDDEGLLSNAGDPDVIVTFNEAEEIDLYAANETDDSRFTVNDLERLLRFDDLDATSLSNRLPALLPTLFGSETPPQMLSLAQVREEEYARRRMRRMFTHASWDLVRFNMPPNFTDLVDDPTMTLPTLTSEDGSELSMGLPSWNPTAAAAPRHFGVFPTGQTFNTLWSANGALQELNRGLRVDLNRALPDYNPTDTNVPSAADLARTALARDLYILLFMANRPRIATAPTTAEERAHLRTLAQIAVNIVDYRDTDDAMTRLVFDDNLYDGSWDPPLPAEPTPTAANTVFGFELPRLVISEAAALTRNYDDTVSDPMNPTLPSHAPLGLGRVA